MSRTVKKSAERKDELLDIAIRLFLQQGFENTSVKDIYMEASGSFGMFYHHFKSKEEIFAMAMDRFVGQFIDKFSEILCDNEIPLEKRYSVAVIRLVEFLHGRDKVCGYEREEIDISVFRLMSLKILSESIQPVELFLEECMENGKINIDDTHQAAIFITYGIYGILREEGLRTSSNKNALSVLSKVSELISKALDCDAAIFKIEIGGMKEYEN